MPIPAGQFLADKISTNYSNVGLGYLRSACTNRGTTTDCRGNADFNADLTWTLQRTVWSVNLITPQYNEYCHKNVSDARTISGKKLGAFRDEQWKIVERAREN